MSLSHNNSTESQQCDHCSSNLTRKEKPQPEGPEAVHCPLRRRPLVFYAGGTVVCEDSGRDRSTGDTRVCSVSLEGPCQDPRGDGTEACRSATGQLPGGGWNLNSVAQMANDWPGLRATFESYLSVASQLCRLVGGVNLLKHVS